MTPDQEAQVKQIKKHYDLLRVDIAALAFTVDDVKYNTAAELRELDAKINYAIWAVVHGGKIDARQPDKSSGGRVDAIETRKGRDFSERRLSITGDDEKPVDK